MMVAHLKVAQTMSYLIRKIMLEVFDSTYNKFFIHVSQPHFALSCFPKQSGILSNPLIFFVTSVFISVIKTVLKLRIEKYFGCKLLHDAYT